MNHWLIKSDPDSWSWDDQWAAPGRTTCWDGVRNAQAANNMKAMKRGDRALFYLSQKDKSIVGLVEIVKTYYPDPSDESGRFGMVDVKAIAPARQPVTLKQVKAEPSLESLALVRQSRLSVMPVEKDQWKLLCNMAGLPLR